jgi:site-specific DNA recombinase
MPRHPKKHSQSAEHRVPTAVYTRVSTEEQALEGFGLEVQSERCRALAVAKGWQVVAEFSDAGVSGTKAAAERSGLAALLEAARRGEVKAVIVLALDRLGRKTTLVLSLVEQLAAAGCALVSCKESLDTSTPQGQFVLTMFAALAQLERDTLVERTTAGRNQRGKRDGERGGRVPYGYLRRADGTVEVEETAAQVVRRIFALRRQKMTLRAIAEQLNAEGVTTARVGETAYADARWYASTVRSVLANERAYRGGRRGASDVRWQTIL